MKKGRKEQEKEYFFPLICLSVSNTPIKRNIFKQIHLRIDSRSKEKNYQTMRAAAEAGRKKGKKERKIFVETLSSLRNSEEIEKNVQSLSRHAIYCCSITELPSHDGMSARVTE